MANNKNYNQNQDTESSPLIGLNTQVESPCEAQFRQFREKYRLHMAGTWLLVIGLTGIITYFVNYSTMVNIEPGTCVSDRSKTSGLLVSFFFGIVGGDRFYLGYPLAGALKAITGGGAGIWWVYDFVLLAMGVLRESNGCVLA